MKKILFAASEAAPFIKSGGLGDVIGSLPKAISNKDTEVAVVVPLHEGIGTEYREKMTYITHIFVPVAWRNQYCGIFRYEEKGVTWYFIDNEYYFKRGSALYGCYDDAERFAFFSSAVLEFLPYIDYYPDIIHCHDWQTALVPIFYKLKYFKRFNYENIKVIFTIHNIEYQGVFDRGIVEDVFGIPIDEFDNGFLEFGGAVNLMKAAILCSDKVTTVSASYAEEIQTPEYAHGLDSILRRESYKLSGIINGIDLKAFDPSKDKRLFYKFSKKDMSGKAKNKAALQALVNLPVDETIPVIGMVTRLVSHKGLDLVSAIIDELLEDNVQLVIVGTGDWKYEQFLRDKQWQYPFKLSVNIAFNSELAQKVYGGSDMFLMPSKSEPCGLAQMIALRYGTIPIVRETGGLRDSITNFDEVKGIGNGFSFEAYDSVEMLSVIHKACKLYNDKEIWNKLVDNGINTDFSWKKSAKKYNELYDSVVE